MVAAVVDGRHVQLLHSVTTFKDDVNLYFLTEFIPGAPLHLHLRSSSNGHFEVERCRFYTAQVPLFPNCFSTCKSHPCADRFGRTLCALHGLRT